MSDVTEIGALIVAGIGVASAPITARLAYSWARRQDAERWQRERVAETDRWHRADDVRRIERGEAAAGQILTLVDQARLKLMRSKSGQMEFEHTYHEIRRLANVLTDDVVQARIFEVADALFFYQQAEMDEPRLSRGNIAHAYAEAAHQVLRAYLLGRACPATPRLSRLTALIASGGERFLADSFDDDPDPLDRT